MDARLETVFNDWKSTIDDRLSQILAERKHPQILYEPIQYVLKGGGKRIRPLLLILACHALEGKLSSSWNAAAAVELLHDFTLVHDDIMDQDEKRRGRPTVHSRWDTNVALLAGDGLVAIAFDTLLQTRSPKIADISRIFTRGIIELCEGQAMDMAFETGRPVTMAEYITMIEKKTAKLLEVSAQIGAMLADGSASHVQSLADFGRHLGCGFQIQDDLLDITSSEETIGKSFASDIRRRKQTYLLLHAYNSGDTTTKTRLSTLLNSPELSSEQIAEVQQIFTETGAVNAARDAGARYFQIARRNLLSLPETEGRTLLLLFLEYVEKRNA